VVSFWGISPTDPKNEMKSNAADHFFADRALLGTRLKWWRSNHGFKIQSAAQALGVSTSTWGHWETGHSFPSGEMLLGLCRLMDLPMELLFCPHIAECPFYLEVQGAGGECTCQTATSSTGPQQ
jgi:DNA-binding XRE family transcriptional regulator